MSTPADANQSKIRGFFVQQASSLNSLISELSEPFKAQFTQLKDTYDAVLKTLPPTEQAPAALEAAGQLQAVFSALLSAQGVVTFLSNSVIELKKKADESTGLMAQLQQRCTDFEAKIKSGELVAKTQVTELCSQARDAALAEGEKKVRDEVAAAAAKTKLVDERKTQLASANLPIPAEAILLEADEAFNARKAKAATRTEALKGKGVTKLNSSLVAEAAWGSDADYERAIGLIEACVPAKPSVPGAPLLNPGTATKPAFAI